MRRYELTVVLRPDFDADNVTKREEVVKKLLGGNAAISEVTVIGKKPLAYPIKKYEEGVYLLVKLEAKETLRIADIERQMRLGEDVIRYLLTAE